MVQTTDAFSLCMTLSIYIAHTFLISCSPMHELYEWVPIQF